MSDVTVLALGLGSIFGAVLITTGVVVRTPSEPTGVAKSLAVIGQLGATSRPAATGDSLVDRVLRPSLRSLGHLAKRLTPAGSIARLQRQLDLAGNPSAWPLERVLAAKGTALLICAVLAFVLGSDLAAGMRVAITAGVAAFGLYLPDILIYNSGIKRQEEVSKSLAEGLDLLTVSVEAGLGFDAALAQVARNTEGPIAREFFRVLQEMQIGMSRTEAFTALAARTSVDELRTFVSALVQADRLGVPIASVLREQAREMRLKRRQRAEEKAQQVPVKILFPLMLCVMPALFIVVLGPGAIQIMDAF